MTGQVDLHFGAWHQPLALVEPHMINSDDTDFASIEDDTIGSERRTLPIIRPTHIINADPVKKLRSRLLSNQVDLAGKELGKMLAEQFAIGCNRFRDVGRKARRSQSPGSTRQNRRMHRLFEINVIVGVEVRYLGRIYIAFKNLHTYRRIMCSRPVHRTEIDTKAEFHFSVTLQDM